MLSTKLLWAHAGDLPAGWPLLGHSHPFYHLMFFKSGKATFLLDHVPCNVSAGDCLIVPPGVRHEISDIAHSLFETYELKFELHEPLIEAALRQRGPVIRGNRAYLEKALQYIVYSWSRPDPFLSGKLEGLLDSLLLSIYLEKNISLSQVSAFIDTSAYSELTNQIIKYLEDNQTEVFRLDDLTRVFGYNKRYLCTTFRKNTGVTILEYLNHIRIRQAASHLHYHSVPISVVGQTVGFVTSIHFTRVFKQLVGITPSRFREVYSLGEESGSDPANSRGHYSALYEEALTTRLLSLEASAALLRKLGDIAAGKVPVPQTAQP